MNGCEMVWPCPMLSAPSSYARWRRFSGTNASRGTRPMAASVAGSRTPRAAICCATMRARASANGSSAGGRSQPSVMTPRFG